MTNNVVLQHQGMMPVDNENNRFIESLRLCGEGRREYTGHPVVVLEDRTIGRRLWLILSLRSRVWLAKRRLLRQGAVDIRVIAVYPRVKVAQCVYELSSPAARYAESNLLTATNRWCGLRRIVALVAGCDPGVGAVWIARRVP